MPRLSLWNPRKGNDYKFVDNMVKAHFEHGGTALLIHKYVGSVDETDPNYDPSNPPIQDLLFMENRDRKYDTTIFELRGTYTVSDQDFDLSQFGMFLGTDQSIFQVHINDMVERLGRKLMTGDVIELPHMRDDLLLDDEAEAVNQYWVVQEGSKSSEGFDPGWWPHIWRIRCKQLQDTQEYSDIFGTGEEVDDLKNLLSTYNQELNINEAIVSEAQENVPGKYYDYRKNNLEYAVEDSEHPSDVDFATVESGNKFPTSPYENAYFLRTDYSPHRLFQYRDNKWYKIEDDDGSWQVGNYLHHQFINNDGKITLDDGTEIVSRVNLSKAIRPKIDDEG
jgi:hypothetical protein